RIADDGEDEALSPTIRHEEPGLVERAPSRGRSAMSSDLPEFAASARALRERDPRADVLWPSRHAHSLPLAHAGVEENEPRGHAREREYRTEADQAIWHEIIPIERAGSP